MTDTKANRFDVLVRMACDPKTSRNELAIGILLAIKYYDPKTQAAWPSQTTLAKDLGFVGENGEVDARIRSVQRSLKRVEEACYIARQIARGRSTAYTFRCTTQEDTPDTHVVTAPDTDVVSPTTPMPVVVDKPPTPMSGVEPKPPTPVSPTPDTSVVRPPTPMSGTPDTGVPQPLSNNNSTSSSSVRVRELPLDRLCKTLRVDMSVLVRKSAFMKFPDAFAGWLERGYDPEQDIWPAIEAARSRWETITSPKYFEKAIKQRFETRMASQPSPRERWETRLFAYHAEGYWSEAHWGPKPGAPGCKVPPEIMSKPQPSHQAELRH